MANNRRLNQFVGIVENNGDGGNAPGPFAALARQIAALRGANGQRRAIAVNMGPFGGANYRQRNQNTAALEAEAAALEAEIAGYETRAAEEARARNAAAAEEARVRNAAAAREAAINAGLDPFNTAFYRSLIPDDQMNSLSNNAANKEYRKITRYAKYRGWEGIPKRTAILEKERAEVQRLADLGFNMNQYHTNRLAATARGNLPEFNARYANMVQRVGNRRVPGEMMREAARHARAELNAGRLAGPALGAAAAALAGYERNYPVAKTRKNRKSRRRN